MNEVANRNENLPTNGGGAADYFSQYGEQAAMRTIVGKLLKFSKGDYMAGENNEDIAEGTELAANMDSLAVGWIKWQDNKPAEQMMGLVCEGYQPPKRKDLDDNDETTWELDENNQPRDPWQFTNQIVLKEPGDPEGQLYTFSTSSRGGINAMGELCKTFGKHSRQAPDDMPVVALSVGSYMHSNKAYGKIKFPILPVKGWVSKYEFADVAPELPLESTATKALPQTKF